MDIRWMVYSIDENIKISQMKSWEYSADYDFQKLQNWITKNNIKWLIDWSYDFHFKLSLIKSKPYIIYYKWDISLLNKQIIWIVWPRKISNYGQKILENLFEKLDWYDISTISWLAEWVDSLCHDLSINKNIPTIAVLWWWFAHFLKSTDRYDIEKIVDNWWVVISEFKLWYKPAKYTFPQRNRIIAWLSDFLFLPEAWEKSGSLITVDFALDMNKIVYATPNDIFSETSKWVNKYISEWKIRLVHDLDEFIISKLWEKSVNKKPCKNIENLQGLEKDIYEFININWSQSIDVLSLNFRLDINILLSILSILELKWFVMESKPWIYSVF